MKFMISTLVELSWISLTETAIVCWMLGSSPPCENIVEQDRVLLHCGMSIDTLSKVTVAKPRSLSTNALTYIADPEKNLTEYPSSRMQGKNGGITGENCAQRRAELIEAPTSQEHGR